MNKSKISTMNISRHSMKKTDIQGSAPPQLQIEFINRETLGSWWSQTLPGIHWRLYRHSALGAALTFLYYRVMAFRQFGGITGDTEGFFLQICECAMVLSVLLAQKAGEVL